MDDERQTDPIALFNAWFEEAKRSEPNDANAMTIASATAAGRPSARMVLLKDASERGFTFYTNYESRKGRELIENPQGALLFHWKSLRRQVRAVGRIEQTTAEESDAYFASRQRGSQIGAWASEQSRPLPSRFELEKRVAQFTAKFGLGRVPRPPHWSGFRLVPDEIEFWKDGMFRLHDRLVYHRTDGGWRTEKLYP
ncbi:MAG: pyridoxamine 5'-phosphate oxidase [Alphaproteobacteria bacterium]